MQKKTATISYGNVKEYATVPARLKAFREENLNGSIETHPTVMDDGVIMFTTTIIKDLRDPASARATGSALGKSAGQKAFEKLETISVGRALALLGYAASGDIASSEEMEEFNKFKDDKVKGTIESLQKTKTLDELKDIFSKLPGNIKALPEVIKTKDEMKVKLSPKEVVPKKPRVKKEVKVEEGEVDPELLPPDLK